MNTQKQAPPWIPIGGTAKLEHFNGAFENTRIEKAQIHTFETGEYIELALKDAGGDFFFLVTKPVGPYLLAAYNQKTGTPTGATVSINPGQ